MTPEDLRAICEQSISDLGRVVLVIQRLPTGERIRLTPRSGPTGYVLCVNMENETVASFDARAVLRWLDKQEKGDE